MIFEHFLSHVNEIWSILLRDNLWGDRQFFRTCPDKLRQINTCLEDCSPPTDKDRLLLLLDPALTWLDNTSLSVILSATAAATGCARLTCSKRPSAELAATVETAGGWLHMASSGSSSCYQIGFCTHKMLYNPSSLTTINELCFFNSKHTVHMLHF